MIGVPYYGTYTEIFNTNDISFGGSGSGNPQPVHSVDVKNHGYDQSASFTVAPMSVMFFEVKKEERPKVKPPKMEIHKQDNKALNKPDLKNNRE